MAATADVRVEVQGLDEARDGVSAFKGAVDILGGSVETLVGGLGLLGAQPQWLASIEDGAVKAIAFADGISRLADGVVEVGEYLGFFNKTVVANTAAEEANTVATATNTTGKVANTTATKGLDTATKAATVSTKAFSTALKGAGIGLFIAGLAAIIANFDAITEFFGFTAPEVGKSFEENVRLQQKALDIAKAQGKTTEEQLEIEIQLLIARENLARERLRVAREIGEEEAIKTAEADVQAASDAVDVLTEKIITFFDNKNQAQKDFIKAASQANADATREQGITETQAVLDFVLNSGKSIQQALSLQTSLFRQERIIQANQELEDLQEQLDQKLITQDTYDKAVANARQNLAYDLEQIDKESAERSIQLAQQVNTRRVDQFARALSAIQELQNVQGEIDEEDAEAAFERNKKYSIAQALIQTGLAVTAALTAGGNPIKLATGAQFVEAGIALANGLAQVKAIKNTEFEGGGDLGNIEAGSGGGGALADFNDFSLQAAQRQQAQIGGLIAGETIKAYVVSGEVTSGQQADQQLQNRRTL